jgi:ADP-ribosylation factor related protein 1
MDKNYKRPDPRRGGTPTVGLNVGKIRTAGLVIQFWDLGGQTELQSLWDKVHYIIAYYVYDFRHLFALLGVCVKCKRFGFHIIYLQYYSESHGVIYVIDSYDRERIEESKDAFGKILLR